MEDKLVVEINKGVDAQRILENQVYKDAIEGVRSGLVNSMASSAMGDEKTHNRLVIALQLLDQIDRNLKTVMQTGKMARIQVEGGAIQKIRGIA